MIIAKGAEATIEQQENNILKTRVVKSYRLPIIDQQLRKQRTRAEFRILERLQKINFPAPKVQEMNEQDMHITMEYIAGEKLRDVLNKKNADHFADQIANLLKQLHEHDIIHSDLTTSNMMVKENSIVVIDFGLSFISKKVEDRAVDLHLLHRALTSYHQDVAEEMFARIKKNYADSVVLERLEEIEKRGRYKQKG